MLNLLHDNVTLTNSDQVLEVVGVKNSSSLLLAIDYTNVLATSLDVSVKAVLIDPDGSTEVDLDVAHYDVATNEISPLAYQLLATGKLVLKVEKPLKADKIKIGVLEIGTAGGTVTTHYELDGFESIIP